MYNAIKSKPRMRKFLLLMVLSLVVVSIAAAGAAAGSVETTGVPGAPQAQQPQLTENNCRRRTAIWRYDEGNLKNSTPWCRRKRLTMVCMDFSICQHPCKPILSDQINQR